jgi:hypothetical protein
LMVLAFLNWTLMSVLSGLLTREQRIPSKLKEYRL